MKIRQGFVSNSSSSSFVVAFPTTPTCVEDVQKFVFQGEIALPNPYQWGDAPFCYPASEVAATIWNDIQKNGALKDLDAVAAAMDGLRSYSWEKNRLPGEPEDPTEDYQVDWDDELSRSKYFHLRDEYYSKLEAWRREYARQWMEKNPGVYYHFEYADEDGTYYSALEHGDTFRKLPHVTISHH